MEKEKVSVRYIVNDVKESVSFYKEHLGFEVDIIPTSGFAALSKGDVKLFLNQPGAGGAGQKMPDGQLPEPGGWNRIQISVDDLASVYEHLKTKGVEFRNDIVEGIGGKQVLVKDPAGNLVELFQPGEKSASYIPAGYHSITPFIATDSPDEVIEFLKNAFGGEVANIMKSDDGILRHATVKVGDSLIMISHGTDLYEPMPLTLHLFVEDVNETYNRALRAGATSLEEPHDEFYGERRSAVKDKWNNRWWIATHTEDLSEVEMKKREKEFRQKMTTHM